MQNIEIALATEFDKDTSEIDREIDLIQRELLHFSRVSPNGNMDNSGYRTYEEIAAELHKLRVEKQEMLEYNVSRESRRRRIAELDEFLKGQKVKLEEYDDKLVRMLVEKVMVFDGCIKVEFKSGVEIKVGI